MTRGGYARTWRSTSNGLEGIASLHNDTLLCLDEIGEATPKALSESVYMLANGIGKTRATQSGEAKTAKTWRCMLLSTGEKIVAEKMAEEKVKAQAGQEVRLIDIPVDAEAGYGMFENLHSYISAEEFAGAINEAAVTNYGHAGPAFVLSLLENIEEAKTYLRPEKINTAANTLLSDVNNASAQVKRVARRFALLAVAGEMASQWKIVPWERGEALESIKKCFEAYVSHRDGVGSSEDTAIVKQVMHFIEQHGSSRFQPHDDLTSRIFNQAGFRQNDGNKIYYYFTPKCFEAEFSKRACAALVEAGLLLKGDSGSFTRRPSMKLPNWGRKRCYTIVIDNGEGLSSERKETLEELDKVLKKADKLDSSGSRSVVETEGYVEVEVSDLELQKILSEGDVVTCFIAIGEEAESHKAEDTEKFDDPINKSVPYNE